MYNSFSARYYYEQTAGDCPWSDHKCVIKQSSVYLDKKDFNMCMFLLRTLLLCCTYASVVNSYF